MVWSDLPREIHGTQRSGYGVILVPNQRRRALGNAQSAGFISNDTLLGGRKQVRAEAGYGCAICGEIFVDFTILIPRTRQRMSTTLMG